MSRNLMLSVLIKEEKEGGYSVLCPGLDVASQGETFEEAIANIREAVELYIESAEELGIMDEVLDKLGLTKQDLRKKSLLSNIVTANVPIEVAM